MGSAMPPLMTAAAAARGRSMIAATAGVVAALSSFGAAARLTRRPAVAARRGFGSRPSRPSSRRIARELARRFRGTGWVVATVARCAYT